MENAIQSATSQALLGFHLSVFDTKNKTGKLVITRDGKQKTFNVRISPLLNYYLNKDFTKRFGKHVTEMKFKSTLRSQEFQENPFKLLMTKKGEAVLFLVYERSPLIKLDAQPVGPPTKTYINRYYSKKDYIRFIDVRPYKAEIKKQVEVTEDLSL